MNRLKCLVLISPTLEKSELYNKITSKLFLDYIEPLTIDGTTPYGASITFLTDTVLQTIESADLVIADLTNNNPNILYELGYAHALKKPVLPIVEKGFKEIPSDLSGYLHFAYDRENLDELIVVIRQWIKRVSATLKKSDL